MAKMKFKVGDKVKFKKDLVEGEEYNGLMFLGKPAGMDKAKIYTLLFEDDDGALFIMTEKKAFWVTPEMIELVERNKKNTKFKIGDIVVIKNKNDGAKFKVIGGPERSALGNAYRLTCINKYQTIGTSKSDSKSSFDYFSIWVTGKDLELDKEETPTITEHLIRGYKTIVKLSNGKVGIAQCSPEDKFDVYEGLRVATARAYGKEIEEPKKEEPKFEVWDRVRYTGEEGDFGEGTIVEISDEDIRPYLVLFDKPNFMLHDGTLIAKNEYPPRCWWCGSKELEKI